MEDSEWLQEVLRYSLKASPYSTTDDKTPHPNPRFGKLVEGILFSRRLVLTYHFVIVGVIVLLSAGHWTGKFIRWRRRRAARLQTSRTEYKYDGDDVKTTSPYSEVDGSTVGGNSSSGSSTIVGTTSPIRKKLDEDEESPLLLQGHAFHPLYPRRTSLSSIRAFLLYQPRPIPFFNKVLPSNGVSLILLAFIGLNIFYMFFHINFNMFESFVLADRFGLLFVANLPYLYILAAKNQPLKFLLGQSYESLNLIHRRLGELLCLQALFHFSGMIVAWYEIIRPNGFGLIRFLLLKVPILGLVALISYELLYLTSLASFRQRWYELFLGLHIVLQVVGLVFLFFHHSAARPYVGVSLAIFLIDRLVYRIGVKSRTVEAKVTIMEDDETVKLSTNIILKHPHYLDVLGKSITAGWAATDHVFVTIPSLGRKHLIQAHPFTIASRAPTSENDNADLELLIRARDGFSADLLMRARSHKSLSLRLDGPHGSSHARTLLESSSISLIIAGGSGIAVAWPLVHHLLDTNRSTDTEIAPRTLVRGRKIVLVWIIHEAEHMEWIGRKALHETEIRGVEMDIPRATSEIGRPDLRGIMEKAIGVEAMGKKVGVVVSGPDGMDRTVRNICAGMVGDGLDVAVAVEKFGW